MEQYCHQCPRECRVDRDAKGAGYCGMPNEIYVSRCAPHMWEEPPISGTRGSGTLFFTGCNLRCVFCQNAIISRERKGKAVDEKQLKQMIFSLVDLGVHNINLVTPTHYTDNLVRILEDIKSQLSIPVVWNSSGYESVASLQRLEGLVDVYLPDFKYISRDLSSAYSGAPDYAEVASLALQEMYRQVGDPLFDSHGLITKGLIVRHLVLPGCRRDSIAVVKHLSAILPKDGFKLSLMRQYTPEFAKHTPYKNLHRRVTDFEYSSVVEEALRLGLDGYTQGKDSATVKFTPDF
ncbi:MAG: 4Fe-4S cluster-binding domain-containing protein [Ruminococcaceae bacterium]|nr:4Fe-4S cluster-binding domain-containing protein [Oscillospiraceae bacterium]